MFFFSLVAVVVQLLLLFDYAKFIFKHCIVVVVQSLCNGKRKVLLFLFIYVFFLFDCYHAIISLCGFVIVVVVFQYNCCCCLITPYFPPQ